MIHPILEGKGRGILGEGRKEAKQAPPSSSAPSPPFLRAYNATPAKRTVKEASRVEATRRRRRRRDAIAIAIPTPTTSSPAARLNLGGCAAHRQVSAPLPAVAEFLLPKDRTFYGRKWACYACGRGFGILGFEAGGWVRPICGVPCGGGSGRNSASSEEGGVRFCVSWWWWWCVDELMDGAGGWRTEVETGDVNWASGAWWPCFVCSACFWMSSWRDRERTVSVGLARKLQGRRIVGVEREFATAGCSLRN